MSSVKYGIAELRPCVRWQLDMADFGDLQKWDKQRAKHTVIAREEYVRLMWRNESMDKNDNLKRKRALFASRISCLFCHSRKENGSLNMLDS